MSTQTISNVSLLREPQTLQQDQRTGQTAARPERLIQDPAFVVTLNISKNATRTESRSQQNQDFYHQRKADLQQLGQALRAGDAEAAQQAYDALVALGQNGPLKNGQAFHRADRAQDFAAIGEALASGNWADASAAFTTLANTFGNHGRGAIGSGSAQIPPGPPTHIPPPSSGGGGPVGPPESGIVINVGGSSSTGHAGEVVVNLQPSATPEEVQINFGDQRGSSGQLLIDVQRQNGGEAVAISLKGSANHHQLILNLFQSSASATQSGSLSLSA